MLIRASVFSEMAGCVKKKAPRPFVLEAVRTERLRAFALDILRKYFYFLVGRKFRRRRRDSPYIDVPYKGTSIYLLLYILLIYQIFGEKF